MTRFCTECLHYAGQFRSVGNCSLHGYLVVAAFDGPRCPSLVLISGAAASLPARSVSEDGQPAGGAANSCFFEAVSDPLETHQRRCSTADESGVPENAC